MAATVVLSETLLGAAKRILLRELSTSSTPRDCRNTGGRGHAIKCLVFLLANSRDSVLRQFADFGSSILQEPMADVACRACDAASSRRAVFR